MQARCAPVDTLTGEEVEVVVWLILVIGIMNFVLGYAMAVQLEPYWAPRWLGAAPPSPQPVAAKSAEMSGQWREMLEESQQVVGDFVGASVGVLRLHVGEYRSQLIAIDEEVRKPSNTLDDAFIQKLLSDLETANQDWMTQQSEAASQLFSQRGALGGFDDMANDLEAVLLEQAAQVETSTSNIQELDFESDPQAGRQQLIAEIRKLLDLAHILRDRVQDALLAVAKAEKKLESLDESLYNDSLTGMRNRSGLELALHGIWQSAEHVNSPCSSIMVDIDAFGQVLERHGALPCDHVLTALADVLSDLLRTDAGFDFAARFNGQRFVVLLSDTAVDDAAKVAERIRQEIAAATFLIGDARETITICCGVTDLRADDGSESLLRRLHSTVREAKKHGPNCTLLDAPDGQRCVEDIEFETSGREIVVGE